MHPIFSLNNLSRVNHVRGHRTCVAMQISHQALKWDFSSLNFQSGAPEVTYVATCLITLTWTPHFVQHGNGSTLEWCAELSIVYDLCIEPLHANNIRTNMFAN